MVASGLIALAWALALPPAIASAGAGAGCEWQPGFFLDDLDGNVNALAVYDDGTGPALYAGGSFAFAGGVPVANVARWDGTSWSALTGPSGTGADDVVRSLAVFDDGGGPALYVGGSFDTAGGVTVNRIAKWDGATWSALTGPSGAGVNGFGAGPMATFDDGTGPALYVGGSFDAAGGVSADNIARWDGASWSALTGPSGNGTNQAVGALAVHDDGGGPALYAGGSFSTAGGILVDHVARWDGTGWSDLSGPSGTGVDDSVSALAVFDDGAGLVLYVGGGVEGLSSLFTKWTGSDWVTLPAPDGPIYEFAVHDDGGGAALYAGGYFDVAGGVIAWSIAKWNGASWSAMGGPNGFGIDPRVFALASYDDGGGAALYAGGDFTTAGGIPAGRIARWNGAAWSRPAPAEGGGIESPVRTLAVFDDGGGPALYAGGDFFFAGDLEIRYLAKWDGGHWTPLEAGGQVGTTSTVRALAVHDDGGGPALYAGGDFFDVAGTNPDVNFIAEWNGSAWSPLAGPAGTGVGSPVYAIASFDDGGGADLYAGGFFTTAGGIAASHVARWDGTEWSALGSGFPPGVNGFVKALAVHDDGSGPALYLGGHFTLAGGLTANRIARWDGAAFSPLGGPNGNGMSAEVDALAVFDDGSGPALYAGGPFRFAGGVEVNRIARWDGSAWSPLAAAGGVGLDGPVRSLAVFDDGDGPALYVGGDLTTAGGVPVNNIARWDGTAWSAVSGPAGDGVLGPPLAAVLALATFDDGDGPDLYAGGDFQSAGGIAARNVGRFACPSPIVFADGFESGDTSAWSGTVQ